MLAYTDLEGRQSVKTCKNLLVLSAVFFFTIGLSIGVLIAVIYFNKDEHHPQHNQELLINIPQLKKINSLRSDSAVTFLENERRDDLNSVIEDGIYWGERVERDLPEGYHEKKHRVWSDYVEKAVAVKLENGCGRMQNRLVVFQDGLKGCVRYRQNTDQIQGELFSFYLAQILGLPNLAPSTISIVDLKQPLWRNLANDISSAQWSSNKPVVLTQFIHDLNSANIPQLFKPVERHLNKFDVLNMTQNNLIELAQWSDLIIFDYLTANLDRIVNNLYNYQWNVNIMDAPAHNLARKSDSELLVFLDNESGLLHGYRLLKKYEIYHSILLENLCVFRRKTADAIRRLKKRGNVGEILRGMFERENGDVVKDLLPTLPDKSVKILNERIDKVYGQITKCESMFADDKT